MQEHARLSTQFVKHFTDFYTLKVIIPISEPVGWRDVIMLQFER